MNVNIGDYVLATKYKDGDPNDPWCVGFVYELMDDRILVDDGNGHTFRLNGFRRAHRITQQFGDWLINEGVLDRISLLPMPSYVQLNIWGMFASNFMCEDHELFDPTFEIHP